MQEEELKNRIGKEYFNRFDYNRIIGKIDFCVSEPVMGTYHNLLWAEAKKGVVQDLNTSFVQLILTIGRSKTYSYEIPPKFLGSFDEEKISFIEYSEIQYIFSQNDFNWNVPPSDHSTKEFLQLYGMVEKCLNEKSLNFAFGIAATRRHSIDQGFNPGQPNSDDDLRKFIDDNFIVNLTSLYKIQVDKNNFVHIFNRWLEVVKPTILVKDWDAFNKKMILSADFFLADLMSDGNKTIIEKLRVLFDNNVYKLKVNVKDSDLALIAYSDIHFKDNQKAHNAFWNIYERPPKEVYQQYILERRDLLVPQDIRERKGAYFTPQKWVTLSQQYIAKALGDDWQDEYYIWDCCAGTGNLLVGLTNKYKIFASTLDQADVSIMKERAENGANLLEDNIFQFDFLNDSFDDPKVPEQLREILKSPKKRKKLVIYINPPYAEAANKKTTTGTGKNKTNVSNSNTTWKNYIDQIGKSGRELFVQFIIRCYIEIQGCIIAEFSKTKHLQSPNFSSFRDLFQARLMKSFLVPSFTFDNVSGLFPIGFFVWNTDESKKFVKTKSDVFDAKGEKMPQKLITDYGSSTINKWLKQFENDNNKSIGAMCCIGSDFGHSKYINIDFKDNIKGVGNAKGIAKFEITKDNLLPVCIYFSVRQCIAPSWLNDRDQFLYPNDKYLSDSEFHNDCLAFALFHTQNRISCENGTNHWIPFTEIEVGARREFKSHFMTDFISGKDTDIDDEEVDNNDDGHKGGAPSQAIYDSRQTSHSKPVRKKKTVQYLLFDEPNIMFVREPVCESENKVSPLVFSDEAKDVFEAGRNLWSYYHKQEDSNPDASFYDIRKHFQGVNDKGKMNADSEDEEYMRLIGILKEKMKFLAKKIEPKVYEYGFLR